MTDDGELDALIRRRVKGALSEVEAGVLGGWTARPGVPLLPTDLELHLGRDAALRRRAALPSPERAAELAELDREAGTPSRIVRAAAALARAAAAAADGDGEAAQRELLTLAAEALAGALALRTGGPR